MRLLLASALLFLAVAAGVGFILLAREESPEATVRAELGGMNFTYARAYARDEATNGGGLCDRLSFMASFPGFTPLKSKEGAAQAVTLTLIQKDEGLDPSERPSKLYARFLTPETSEAPGGLILRRFERGSPYDSEELFIAPPDGRSFFARCPKPQAGAPGEGCITVFRQGALDVELRYPAALLEHWDALNDGARALLARMTASSSRKQKR